MVSTGVLGGTFRSAMMRRPASGLQQALTSPPPGTYDPAIDAQVGQSDRGLQDLLSAYIANYGEPGTQLGGRAGEDFQTGQANIQRNLGYGLADVNQGADRSLADLQRSSGRSLADLLTNRGRAGQDYASNVEGLHRNFAQLGEAQTQAARAAGVQRGGALAQALAKRQANEAIDRKPMDTGFARFNQDSQLQQGRLGEDTALGTSRIGEDRTTGLSRLNAGATADLSSLRTGYVRGAEDANTQLGIAGREANQFGLDANAQRFYQANVPLPLPTRKKLVRP